MKKLDLDTLKYIKNAIKENPFFDIKIDGFRSAIYTIDKLIKEQIKLSPSVEHLRSLAGFDKKPIDKVVIKCLNAERGKEILNFFEKFGVTNNNGLAVDSYSYYGPDINNDLQFWDYIPEGYTEIFLETIKTDTKMDKQWNWEQFKRVYIAACPNWKEELAGYAKLFLQSDIVKIPEHKYQEMRKACTKEQHVLFDEIFGKDQLDLSIIPLNELFSLNEDKTGLILSDKYWWDIFKDNGVYTVRPKIK